jgi:hypothetical protein
MNTLRATVLLSLMALVGCSGSGGDDSTQKVPKDTAGSTVSAAEAPANVATSSTACAPSVKTDAAAPLPRSPVDACSGYYTVTTGEEVDTPDWLHREPQGCVFGFDLTLGADGKAVQTYTAATDRTGTWSGDEFEFEVHWDAWTIDDGAHVVGATTSRFVRKPD